MMWKLLSSWVTLPVYRDTVLLNRLERGEEGEGGGVREVARERQGAKNKGERERECGGFLQKKNLSQLGVFAARNVCPLGGEEKVKRHK